MAKKRLTNEQVRENKRGADRRCSEVNRERKRENLRRWRAANPERARQHARDARARARAKAEREGGPSNGRGAAQDGPSPSKATMESHTLNSTDHAADPHGRPVRKTDDRPPDEGGPGRQA